MIKLVKVINVGTSNPKNGGKPYENWKIFDDVTETSVMVLPAFLKSEHVAKDFKRFEKLWLLSGAPVEEFVSKKKDVQ